MGNKYATHDNTMLVYVHHHTDVQTQTYFYITKYIYPIAVLHVWFAYYNNIGAHFLA